jgi:pyruvate formate lyase activating enzyme
MPFLRSSGGGVTVSGGEPLLQKAFLLELFSQLKEMGVHTCIDTNGYTELDDTLVALMKVTDLVLLDIKHNDEATHQKLTAISSKKTWAFADYLSQINKETWIRLVVLPGWTDGEAHGHQLAQSIKKYKNVSKVELLPYHSMAKVKYEMMGLAMPTANLQPPSEEQMFKLDGIFQSYGFDVLRERKVKSDPPPESQAFSPITKPISVALTSITVLGPTEPDIKRRPSSFSNSR